VLQAHEAGGDEHNDETNQGLVACRQWHIRAHGLRAAAWPQSRLPLNRMIRSAGRNLPLANASVGAAMRFEQSFDRHRD
jgi:hypothetical protein